MATFKITTDTSVFTTADFDNAFDNDTASADTLIVDPDAFLITRGADTFGALLANTGAWTVTVNGSIFGRGNVGIELAAGNAPVSKITVGVEGEIGGGTAIIAKSAATITNSGAITGANLGIEFFGAGAHTITNSGDIDGLFGAIVDFDGLSNDKVTNSGNISSGNVDLGGGNDTLINSGQIGHMVDLGAGTNTLTNMGTIGDGVIFGAGINTLTNHGTIGLDVDFASGATKSSNSGSIGHDLTFENGANTFTNSGSVGHDVNLVLGSDTFTNSGSIADDVIITGGTNTFTNSGSIGHDVLIEDGTNTITNSGTIGGGVQLGAGTNTLTNTGTIGGDVWDGGGTDTVTSTGKILGVVDLGVGNDVFTGGKNVETVLDGDGADTNKLGGGNDIYVATGHSGTDGIDTIDAGTGIDTYDASSATHPVLINLDTIAHDDIILIAGNTATGSDVAGAFKDTITNFENANGGSTADLIYGSAAANSLTGGGGQDHLFGLAGNDTLDGGAGTDFLTGGAGKDTLTGGTEADTFIYLATTDSGVSKGARDTITDFQPGLDKIDLSAIDANKANGAATNEAFNFIGTNVAFSHTAGELRAYWTASGQIVEGDVNGDGKADISIQINDPMHNITLSGSDFLL